MYNVYLNLPDFTAEEKPYVKLPRNLDDAKHLGKVIFAYRDTVSFISYFSSKGFLALLARFDVLGVCLCFHANFFNSWFNFLLNSCWFYVALVSSPTPYLCMFWNWCFALLGISVYF